jgi:outer membrane receptor protein involved in Fe transport
MDELTLGDRLAITAGARFDRFGEQRDTALSPRLGVVARPYADAVTKVVVGRAFRSPSVFELYYNDGGITQIAAGSLDPETIWSGEIEHTHPIGQNSFLLASVFASQIDSLINLGTTMDGILIYQNSADQVQSAGGELEARLTAGTGAWVSAAASYAHIVSDDDAVKVNSAELVGAARGLWPISGDRLVLASELVYNSPRKVRGGGQTGHALIGSLFLSGRLAVSNLRFRAGVANILDWDWSAAVGEELVQERIRQAPRTFLAQLVYRFE